MMNEHDSMTPVIVAIDGPAGSGKSSVSREAAKRLGYALLDTGAAYRALAWFAREEGIDLDGEDAAIEREVTRVLPVFIREYRISLAPDERWVRVADTDVTDAIRETAVSNAVSAVARIPEVRATLTGLFRDTLLGANRPGVIAEGRDITTVVAPDAPVRVLLTASEEARIRRRAAERVGDDQAAVARSVAQRDAKDSRVAAFLQAADGVTVLDSSDLDFDETVTALIRLIEQSAEHTAPADTPAPTDSEDDA